MPYAVNKGRNSKSGSGLNYNLHRKKIYWLSQLGGWLLYSIINFIFILLFDEVKWTQIIVLCYLAFVGISFTHIYRAKIKQWGWADIPIRKAIPRIIGASIIIGLIIFVLLMAVNIGIGEVEIGKIKAATIIIGVFNIGLVVLVWSLIYFSVHYFENYKKAEIEALIWEAAVKDFELKTLKSQLNPHFMFNALNSIRALIRVDPPNAQNAITKLSNILRYSLKIDRIETVSLEEEIGTVSDYLELESIRFEERLKYRIEIDPASNRVEIPPMMIQTLVENGIKHGISKRTEGGEILIQSFVIDSKLHIQIKNTGQIDDEALKNSTGFGINNTKHRLNLLYGEEGLFTITNSEDSYVLSEVVIPTGGTNR